MIRPSSPANTRHISEVALASVAPGRLARRVPELPPERTRELARRAESRRDRDLQHGERGLAQELAGTREPQRHVVLVHATTELSAERAFELSQRRAGKRGKALTR